MNPKLTADRLRRRGIVYVRQSSPGQVVHNQESQRRQYGLADHARELGFQQFMREFKLNPGHGYADYLLYVDGGGGRQRLVPGTSHHRPPRWCSEPGASAEASWLTRAGVDEKVCFVFAHDLHSSSVPPRACTATFVGPTGIRHAVEVTAETLFEAAAMGLTLLRKSDWGDAVASGAWKFRPGNRPSRTR